MEIKGLVEAIKTHHEKSKQLDIDENWSANSTAVFNYCDEHLEKLEHLPAYVTLDNPGERIPEFGILSEGRRIEKILEVVKDDIVSPGLNPASGGHLGYIPGGGIPASALGDYIAAVSNKYSGVFYGSPGAVRTENFLIRWMCDIMGYPKTAFGNLTSGGSIANLSAIICARDAHNATGANAEKCVVYLSEQSHHCVMKGLNMAGLSVAHIRRLKMDEEHKICVESFKSQVEQDKADGLNPFLLVASAGTTDIGIIDPLDELADICEENKLWFHVDAAYGGFFILLDELKAQFKGIERSDSIVLDPHKGLFLPYGLGTVLVKDKEHMKKAFSFEANYMQDANEFMDETSPAAVSPELTKHFRGMRMWLPLQLHGITPFKHCLEEKVLLTRYFYERIKEEGFEVGNYPELSVMTYRYVPENGDANEFNEALMNYIKNDGTVFVSSTKLNDKYMLRLAVLSFRTHLSTINTLIDKLIEGKNHLLNKS